MGNEVKERLEELIKSTQSLIATYTKAGEDLFKTEIDKLTAFVNELKAKLESNK